MPAGESFHIAQDKRRTVYLNNILDCHSGIGLESALLFASEGANVVLADINLPAAQEGVSLIEKAYSAELGVQAIAVKADVSKEAEIKALVDIAVEKFGRLDVMVSSGTYGARDCRRLA